MNPQSGTGDPWLKHPTWSAVVAHWRQLHQYHPLTCARCGRQIDTTPGGPWSLDVGHITPRDQARAAGMTVEECNSIHNTQAEHRRCNRQAGAVYRNRKHGNAGAILPPTERNEW